MYLVISLEGYVEEIDNSDVRYLFVGPVSSNKEVLNKFTEVWKAISDQVLKINGSIKNYDGNCNKIRFNSNVALPINTPIKFHALTIVIRFIIEKMVNITQKFT